MSRPRRVTAALVRYLLAATVVRAVDSGAAVGLVALAAEDSTAFADPATVGGVLAAALSAPHILGPFIARFLDRARDGRVVLAVSFLVYGVALAAGALSAGRVPVVATVALVAVAGAFGPMLTGGLSSGLADLAPDSARRRRAEALDSLTYGVGSALGPAAIAALALLLGARTGLLATAAATVAVAALTMTLPRRPGRRPDDGTPVTVRAALAQLWRNGPLRRVATATTLTAVSLGALPVVATLLCAQFDRPSADGGLLVAAFGAGSLAGSVVVSFRPHRADPERLVVRYVAAMALTFAVAALSTDYVATGVALAVAGLLNGPFVAATLAARSEYAPEALRAQVFVTFAGVKIAAASAGAAAAGIAGGLGGRTVLALTSTVTLLGTLTALTDRAASARRTHPASRT